MICRLGERSYRGEAIALPVEAPAVVLDAIHADEPRSSPAGFPLAIDCSPPGPIHDHVGHLHPDMGLRTRTALARAGRTRGLETPYDDDLVQCRAELDSFARPETDGTPAADHRETVAETRADLESLEAEVAAARGHLQACREYGLGTDEAETTLASAIRTLSERETEANAAGKRYERFRETVRDHRDDLEERLRLEDRIANLERQARAHLVDRLREEFATAVERVPGTTDAEDPFDASPLTAALAVVRLADADAPVVLDCDRFDTVGDAHRFLDTPVVQVYSG